MRRESPPQNLKEKLEQPRQTIGVARCTLEQLGRMWGRIVWIDEFTARQDGMSSSFWLKIGAGKNPMMEKIDR